MRLRWNHENRHLQALLPSIRKRFVTKRLIQKKPYLKTRWHKWGWGRPAGQRRLELRTRWQYVSNVCQCSRQDIWIVEYWILVFPCGRRALLSFRIVVPPATEHCNDEFKRTCSLLINRKKANSDSGHHIFIIILNFSTVSRLQHTVNHIISGVDYRHRCPSQLVIFSAARQRYCSRQFIFKNSDHVFCLTKLSVNDEKQLFCLIPLDL